MVDINLIGDDQTQDEGEKGKQDFQNTFESDVNEPTPSSYMGRGSIDDSEFPGMTPRGGSKKTVYLLVFSIAALLLVVAYFIFQPGKNNKSTRQATPSLTENRTNMDSSGAYISGSESSLTPTATLSPVIRERVAKTQRGLNTVTEIMNTVPSNVNFTMISYSDGKFLLEFLASGDPDINNLNSQLQRNLSPAEVKLLSKDIRTIQKRQFRQALVNGDINVNQSASDVNITQAPSYLTSNELQAQLSNICQQAGLVIKQYNSGVEKSDGQLMLLPVQFRAIGQKSNILSFFQQLLSQNINISFAKITLIANDVDLSDLKITLVLNINLYRAI